mmetsp:Transcript_118389/g.166394  ORF Transcript_118389/g.166394 Transcript_118389/m.166394 type:complete len:156 (-) Transcript_118389:21-488(-)
MEEGDVQVPMEGAEAVVIDDDVEDEIEEEAGYDADKAVREALRKALITNTLYRGLREACRILDSRQALFCVLARNCDHQEYVRLVEALCAETGTGIVRVASNQDLGEWAGLCVYDKEGNARKVVGCSCVVVHQDIAKEADPAVSWIIENLKEMAE